MGGRIRIVVTLLIFGAVYGVLDYLGADEAVRTQALIILATITLVKLLARWLHVSN